MNDKRFYQLKANRHKKRVYYPSRRDRLIAETSDGTVNLMSLDQLLMDQKFLCGICGKVMQTYFDRNIDHIIPLIKGGKHSITNLQWTHRICNAEKGADAPWAVNWRFYCDELNRIQNRMIRRSQYERKTLAIFIARMYYAAIQRIDYQINQFKKDHVS